MLAWSTFCLPEATLTKRNIKWNVTHEHIKQTRMVSVWDFYSKKRHGRTRLWITFRTGHDQASLPEHNPPKRNPTWLRLQFRFPIWPVCGSSTSIKIFVSNEVPHYSTMSMLLHNEAEDECQPFSQICFWLFSFEELHSILAFNVLHASCFCVFVSPYM